MKRRTATGASPSGLKGLSPEVMRCLEAWGWDPSPVDEDLVSFNCDGILGAAQAKTSHRNNGSLLTLWFLIDENPHGELADSWAGQERPPLGSLSVEGSDERPELLYVIETPLAKCDPDLGRTLEADASNVWDSWVASVQAEEEALSELLRSWGLEPDGFDPSNPSAVPSGWVAFHGPDVSGRAYRTGHDRSTIRVMYVLDAVPHADTARSWMAKQRKLALGQLELEQLDGENPYLRIVAELPVSAPPQSGRRLRDLAAKLGQSWYDFALTELLPPPNLTWHEAQAQHPQSAWLMLGDEASYPSAKELARQVERAERGVFDIWTASPQTRPGDLLLFYFTGKRKAVHFAARALSYAHFSRDISVNANRGVNDHQWWVRISPMVELEPILLARLREAFNGHLLLKGRSGRYIPHASAGRILAHARPLRPQENRGTLRPVAASLTFPETLTQWRHFAVGELALTGHRVLEARIEEHIVNPLLTLAGIKSYTQQYRVGQGYADYVVLEDGQPASVIEVKVRVKEPLHNAWPSSPDFAQTIKYSRALGGCPAMLLDSHRVFLIDPDADTPSRIIDRSALTRGDLTHIREHLLPR